MLIKTSNVVAFKLIEPKHKNWVLTSRGEQLCRAMREITLRQPIENLTPFDDLTWETLLFLEEATFSCDTGGLGGMGFFVREKIRDKLFSALEYKAKDVVQQAVLKDRKRRP